MQRCKALLIDCIDIGAPLKQEIDTCWEAFVCCPHQTRVTLWIRYVHRYVLKEEKYKEKGVSVDCSKMKDVVARRVKDERICTAG